MKNYYTTVIDNAVKRCDPNYPISIRIAGGNHIPCPPELLSIIREYYATHTNDTGEICQQTPRN